MLNLQDLIFEKKLSRIELYDYKNSSCCNYKISVYRNHSFELVEHTINLYLDYADIKPEFIYSDYDDSMSFLNLDLSSDLIIVWVDTSRYKINNIQQFLNDRLEYLSSIFKKQIIFVPFGQDINITKSNIITYNLNKIKEELKEKYTDERLEAFSGTKLSPKALMLIAKDLGLNYIPSLIKTPIKAVIFDLDNTLYKGVLGEDGYKNIILTEAHKKLQEKAVQLAKEGFFICIASKNEEEDVIEMFKNRQDFPLQLENITKMCVSWESKADSISKIQKFLNIGIQDMLFVDDNMGEIASVKTEHPLINVILAKDDANITLNVLNEFPRMLKLKTNYEDSLRQKDTQANEERERLKNTLTKEEFLKNLEMELTYGLNIKKQIPRISELANKTNQFICSYKRYSQKEVEEIMKDKNSLIITVSLKDKLSESGIIGVMVFRNKEEYVNIEECFISCRALGRGIDENIVLYPVQAALEFFGKNRIKLDFVRGERNKPAEDFINKNLKEYKNTINIFDKKINNDLVKTVTEREF